ncbi:MAG: 23S rRNA pseudouridine(955/2504/2580) synthase RluC [Gammaproteobacteria bacterium]|nr:23S rRNA pseudouridine(955/2504/2580) synthase RluC [Gammaproteobacteria bacterium]MDH5593657.1 23S rRNA pseudouridine(955/2504/2580) synthase RluC [Gammaproteobacteria bacterium]
MSKSSENTPTSVQLIDIGEGSDGQRIDNFLVTLLKGVPKSRIYRILRKGEVRVNKGRIKPEYRLKIGDQVRIPPIRLSESGQNKITPSGHALDWIDNSILYEDDHLLILNKPSGIAVHGGSGMSHGVIEALRAKRPKAPYLELVHRIDRETSGCLMIAKRRSMLRRLHELLREGGMDKSYLTLLQGQWQKGKCKIDLSLQKNVLSSGERMVKVDESGKSSLSLFEPVTIYKHASLMRVEIFTGRTHQIRVHAAHSGHPVAGDSRYGDKEFNKAMRKKGLKRLFLHAHSLSFVLEEPRKEVDISAPLPDDLRAVIDQLDKESK